MKKIYQTVLLVLPLFLSGQEQRGIPDGKAWKKTEGAASKSAIRMFTPEWKNNSVSAGNKKIEFCDDSRIQILSDGEVVMTLQSNYKIEADGKASWLSSDGKEFNRTVEAGDRSFTVKGELSLNGRKWQGYTQTARLDKDGLVQVSLAWQAPPEDFKFSSSGVLMLASYDTMGGHLVKVNGEEVRLPDADNQEGSPEIGTFWRGPAFNCCFLADSPDREFTISGEKAKGFCGLWITKNRIFRYLQFAIHPLQNNRIELTIDIRKGKEPDSQTSAVLHGGANFRTLENLEMPDSSGKNLYRNASFEMGFQGWLADLRTQSRTCNPQKWEQGNFAIDDTVSRFGRSSLRVATNFAPEYQTDYRALSTMGNLTGPYAIVDPGTYTLSWYAKGDRGGRQKLNVWVPNFMKDTTYLSMPGAMKQCPVSGDWQRYSCTFQVPRTDFITVRLNANSLTRDGFVWVDGIQLEKGAAPTPFEERPVEGRLFTSDPLNFLQAGEKIHASLHLTVPPGSRGQARISVKNFFDETVFQETFRYAADEQGKAGIDLPLDRADIGKGLFILRAEYHPDAGGSAYEHHRFSVIEFPDGNQRRRQIFGEDYEGYFRNELFYRISDRMRKIGYGSKTQNESQTRSKEVIDAYRRYGIEPVTFFMTTRLDKGREGRGFAVFVGNDVFDPARRYLFADYFKESNGILTPDYLKRLEDACAECAAAYPWITRWTFSSETKAYLPDSWWSDEGTAEKAAECHARLLKAFADGARRGNPKAKILQDGPCNMAPNGGIAETDLLLKQTGRLGVKFDIIGIHPFRFSPESPDLDSDTKEMLQMLSRHGYGPDTPLSWDEMMNWGPYELPPFGIQRSTWGGPPRTWWTSSLSYDLGWSEKLSAAWRVRSWLVALKYADRILTACSGNTNNFYMDYLLTPFASQLSPNVLSLLLGNSRFLADVRFAPYFRAYVFDDGSGRPVTAVWCHLEKVDSGAADAPRVRADFGDTLDGVFDMMNNRRKVSSGEITFPVSGFPLFFRGKKGTAPAMIAAWQKAVVISGEGLSPILSIANPLSPEQYDIVLTNFISSPVSGTANGMPFELPASGTCHLKGTFPQPLKPGQITSNRLPLEIQTKSGNTYRADLSFDAMSAVRIPESAGMEKVAWANLPEIPFTHQWGAGEKPTSGSFRLAWNSSGLFLEVSVKDKNFVHQEFKNPYTRYANDCVQIYIDTLANARSRQFDACDEDDYEYLMLPGREGKSCRMFRVRSVDQQLGLGTQAPRDMTFADDIPCTFERSATGYVYRVFFPAKYLLPIRLAKGSVFGMGLFVPNCDNDSLNGDKRVTSALTTAGDGGGCYNRPRVWPAVILSE